MREDAELVELAVGGDGAAFSELYERYFDNVYDFLARMVKDRDEAADLAQDTFLRAMNSLSSLSKGGSFKSWLFTIARNTALNRLERSSRVQPLEQQSDEGDGLELQVVDPDRFSNPEEAAEAKDYAGLVWEAASSLDERQYTALHYSVRLGFENEELAEVLGVTRNNAYQIVNRTKAALESAIGALVLLRRGRRFCKELDAALANLAVGEMTPDVKRIIDRHSARCDECGERRRKLASPFAIFAGLAFLQPATGVKAAILEDLQASFAAQYGSGAAASSAGMPLGGSMSPLATDGAGHGGAGGGSAPAGSEGNGPLGGKWKFAMLGVGAALILLLSGGVAFSNILGGDDPETDSNDPMPSVTALAVVQSPSATATPLPTLTATSVPPTETPEPQQSQSEPTQPPLVVPSTATSTPVPPTATSTSTATPTATVKPASTSTPTNCSITMTVSPGVLDYGLEDDSLPMAIRVSGCNFPVPYQLTPSHRWITAQPSGGAVPPNGSVDIMVSVDRADPDLAAPGEHFGSIAVDSVVGRLVVQVIVDVPTANVAPGGVDYPLPVMKGPR